MCWRNARISKQFNILESGYKTYVKQNNIVRGLLELDISKINIDISEIKDILKDYNIKKKYHKLKSGDFLDLTNNGDLNLLDEMTTTLDIDYSKVTNGVVNLPINRSFYLERLTNSNKEISIAKNEKFTELIERDVENYEDKNFKYIIADEAQYIKNSSTQNATSLKSLKGEIKLYLSYLLSSKLIY